MLARAHMDVSHCCSSSLFFLQCPSSKRLLATAACAAPVGQALQPILPRQQARLCNWEDTGGLCRFPRQTRRICAKAAKSSVSRTRLGTTSEYIETPSTGCTAAHAKAAQFLGSLAFDIPQTQWHANAGAQHRLQPVQRCVAAPAWARACVLLAKQMATQSGCVVDHCSWFTSAPALYARIGSASAQQTCFLGSLLLRCARSKHASQPLTLRLYPEGQLGCLSSAPAAGLQSRGQSKAVMAHTGHAL